MSLGMSYPHEEDFKRFVSSVALSRTIDGLLISLESFLFVLEEDSRKFTIDVRDELRYYLKRKEAELFISGVKGCRDSFEYLVLETPRFKLVRKYFIVISEILNEAENVGAERRFECVSPPPLWRKEAVTRVEREPAGPPLVMTKLVMTKKARAHSWIEVALILALAAALAGVLLRFLI